MSLGNLCEREILEHLFLGSGIPSRNELWIGLCSGEPSEDGSDKKELSGNGYGRKKYVGSDKFGGSAGGKVTSNATITLPYATSDWGNVTHFFISTTGIAGETGDTLLAVNELTVEKTIEKGDLPRFKAGELTIQVD